MNAGSCARVRSCAHLAQTCDQLSNAPVTPSLADGNTGGTGACSNVSFRTIYRTCRIPAFSNTSNSSLYRLMEKMTAENEGMVRPERFELPT